MISYMSVLCTLYFHRNPHHPELHSFPTRRSSDLDRARRGLPDQPDDAVDLGGLRPRPADQGTPDRKSTRLNSSHQIISYAVFCLKKKNIKEDSHTNDHTYTSL